MNRNLLRILPVFLPAALLTGCILHSNVFYTPDIVLKKDGQPRISIPANEDFFRQIKEFHILNSDVHQAGVGELWSQDYSDSAKPYYVKNQQCLNFNFHFQTNIPYSICFTSEEMKNNKSQKSTQKDWIRYMRIIRNKDNTLQLLLDEKARNDN